MTTQLKSQLEYEKMELDMRVQELENREAQNESDRKKLQEDLEKNSERNSSLQHAAVVQLKAGENVLKLVEEQKKIYTNGLCNSKTNWRLNKRLSWKLSN